MRIVGLILFVAWGCQAVPAADLAPDDFAAAKKIYTSKCARCHKFYEPSQYNDQEWSLWMNKMRKKARLNPKDYGLVLQFTEQMRKGEDKGVGPTGKADGSR